MRMNPYILHLCELKDVFGKYLMRLHAVAFLCLWPLLDVKFTVKISMVLSGAI